MKQHRGLTAPANNEDAAELEQKAKLLYEDIQAKVKELNDLSVEIDKLGRAAREKDPEIKALSVEVGVKDAAMRNKMNAVPDVAALIEKSNELRAEADKATQRMQELR